MTEASHQWLVPFTEEEIKFSQLSASQHQKMTKNTVCVFSHIGFLLWLSMNLLVTACLSQILIFSYK